MGVDLADLLHAGGQSHARASSSSFQCLPLLMPLPPNPAASQQRQHGQVLDQPNLHGAGAAAIHRSCLCIRSAHILPAQDCMGWASAAGQNLGCDASGSAALVHYMYDGAQPS